MAEKKEVKTVLERTYNVPLRKHYMKVPRYQRAKKAVSAVKIFLMRHMKSENVKLGKFLNQKLWQKGIKNPPHHINVTASKDSDGIVKAELVGAPAEAEEKSLESKTKAAAEKEAVKEESKEKNAEKEGPKDAAEKVSAEKK